MRELREFREAHAEFERAGVALAGVSSDSIESHRKWAERLRIRFPLLSDPGHSAGGALGVLRTIGVAGWTIELLRRATILVDRSGTIVAAWGRVKIRGHAREVLETARVLERMP